MKLRLLINAVDVTANLVEESFSLDCGEGNIIDVAQFELVDTANSLVILDGHEVIIEDFDDALIRHFGGLATEVLSSHDGVGSLWNITCQDWKIILDRSYFSKIYTDQTDALIIGDAFTEAAVTEFDTASLVVSQRTMARLVFKESSLRQMLDVLKSITAAFWDVDAFKKIIYRQEFSDRSSFDISTSPNNTTTFPYYDTTRHLSIGQFNSVDIVRGNRLTEETDVYNGDGTRTTFNLRIDGVVSGRVYHNIIRGPDGADPDIPVVDKNTGTDGTPVWTTQTIGFETSDSGKDVLWNPLTAQVIFTTAPPNFANNSWRINGQYLAPVIWRNDDEAAIASAGRIFRKVLHVPEAESDDQAQDLSIAFLREQGNKDLIQCTINQDGLGIGDAINIDDAIYGVNKLYMVHALSMRILGGETYEYRVSLGNGPLAVEGIGPIIRELSDKAGKLDLNTQDSIVVIRQVSTSIELVVTTVTSEARGPRYIAMAVSPSTYDVVILADSPIGYWRLGETTGTTADDETANDNDGTISAGITLGEEALIGGDQNPCLLFDGASGDVDMGSPAALDDIFSGGGSLEAWINADSDGEVNAGRIMDKGQWVFATVDESGGNLRIQFQHGFASTEGIWHTDRDVTINAAHHVVVTFDRDSVANNPSIYVDNVLYTIGNGKLTETSIPAGAALSDAALNFVVGNRTIDDATFDGHIDEPAVYSSVLTSGQITAHYHAGLDNIIAGRWASRV